MWEFKCPCCGDEFISNLSEEVARKNIGSTIDCQCGALLMIKGDLSVSDFGEELVKRYSEVGLNVSKEKAVNSYIEI